MTGLRKPRPGSEAGFALPGVMFLLLGMMAILSVGAVAAINTQRGTVRDTATKSALAIAETGAQHALVAYSRASEVENLPDQGWCIDGETVIEGEWGEWCPPQDGQLGDGSFQFWVKPTLNNGHIYLEVVSKGTDSAGGMSTDPERLVKLEAVAQAGTAYVPPAGGGTPTWETVLGDELVSTDKWLVIGNSSKIQGPAGSNGLVDIRQGARICGTVRYGIDTPEPDVKKCGSDPAPEAIPGNVAYPPLTMPEGLSIETSATNRFFGEDNHDLSSDYIEQNEPWDHETRTLTLDGGARFYLQGETPYLLCRLVLAGGAELIMDAPDGKRVDIVFDHPENCPDLSAPDEYKDWYLEEDWDEDHKEQLRIHNGSKLKSNGPLPGFFFLGSQVDEDHEDYIPTAAVMAGGATTHNLVIYGPKTDIDISNGFRYTGGMMGRTLHMEGGSEVLGEFDPATFEIPIDVEDEEVVEEVEPVPEEPFAPTRFLECAASSEPPEC